jgi:hypothetical protein
MPSVPPGFTPDATSIFGDRHVEEDASHKGDATKTDAKGGCPSAPDSSPPVQATVLPGNAPEAGGGTITPSTYELNRLYVYTDNAEGGLSELEEQKALVLGTDTFVWAEGVGSVEAGVGAPNVSSGSYTASGTNLTLSPSCPAGADGGSYPYTFAGTGLTIYTSPTTAEFYKPAAM